MDAEAMDAECEYSLPVGKGKAVTWDWGGVKIQDLLIFEADLLK